MYRERMNSYYPQVIQAILEFQAIIDAEAVEFEKLEEGNNKALSDAYLLTMTEDRVAEWESLLRIVPLEGSSIDDRRETVIARIRGQGKLNTSLINSIVATFTGNGCNCWIKDSTLYVELLPFDEKTYRIDQIINNISNELYRKIPAHLGIKIDIIYRRWENIVEDNANWSIVKLTHNTWEDVLYGRRGKANMLNHSTLNNFYLG